MTHTKEPWGYFMKWPARFMQSENWFITGPTHTQDNWDVIAKDCDGKNATRIVAAVNACAGVTLGDRASVSALVEAANDFIRSVSAPVEPSNLAKSPAAAYVFAKELEAALAPFVESE